MKEKGTEKRLLGRGALILTTLIWGTSFVILKSALDDITPLWALCFRFSGASVLMLLLAIPRLKMLDREYLKAGTLMGLMLSAAYTVQTYGLYYTTPGKNAFLTATYCILVPFLYWLFYGKKPNGYNVTAAVICFIGMGLVCLQKDLSVNIGDILTVCCGLFYGLHIIVTSKSVHYRDPLLLTMLQFFVAAIVTLLGALLFEPVPHAIPRDSLFGIAYLSIMCTGVCFLLQSIGQKYTPPSAAAVIMTLESVFGTVLSIILGKEILTAGILTGFCLIFIAILISETKLKIIGKNDSGPSDV